MIKKLYIILFPIILLTTFSSCKNQGNPYLSWRKPSSYIMVNINGALCHLSAYKDSAYVIGINYAEVHGEHLNFSDSIAQIIKVGHCISIENTMPSLVTPDKYNDTDTSRIFVINGHTELEEYNDITNIDSTKHYKFISEFYDLEIDTTYYVRSYAIIKYTSGRIDTAYNQVTHSFRTRIPEDMWLHKPDLNGDGRTEAVSFVLNNKAYMGTGFDGLQLLKDFWVYDPNAGPNNEGAWEQRPEFRGSPRMSAVALVIGDTAYVGTGIIDLVNNTPSGDMWKWTEEGGMYNIWTKVDSLGENDERYNAVAFALTLDNGEDRGYIGLGQNYTNFGDLKYYKPEADTAGAYPGAAWANIEGFLGGNRSEAMVAVVNNRAIVGGGIDNQSVYHSDFFIFDPSAGTSGKWRGIQQTCPAPPRANGTAFSLSFTNNGTQKNYFYFGTGRGTGGTLYNDWWRYDYSQGVWFECSNIAENSDTAEARQGAVGFALTKNSAAYGRLQRGFVGFGKTSSGYKIDFWEYLP